MRLGLPVIIGIVVLGLPGAVSYASDPSPSPSSEMADQYVNAQDVSGLQSLDGLGEIFLELNSVDEPVAKAVVKKASKKKISHSKTAKHKKECSEKKTTSVLTVMPVTITSAAIAP